MLHSRVTRDWFVLGGMISVRSGGNASGVILNVAKFPSTFAALSEKVAGPAMTIGGRGWWGPVVGFAMSERDFPFFTISSQTGLPMPVAAAGKESNSATSKGLMLKLLVVGAKLPLPRSIPLAVRVTISPWVHRGSRRLHNESEKRLVGRMKLL